MLYAHKFVPACALGHRDTELLLRISFAPCAVRTSYDPQGGYIPREVLQLLVRSQGCVLAPSCQACMQTGHAEWLGSPLG